MGKLTQGDFDVVLPGLGRKDEIGQMARGLETFKLKAAEKAAREAAEKEAATKSVEAMRRAEMRKLADDFESAVESMVGTVSSASVELECCHVIAEHRRGNGEFDHDGYFGVRRSVRECSIDRRCDGGIVFLGQRGGQASP